MQIARANLDERAAWILNQTLIDCDPLCVPGAITRDVCVYCTCVRTCVCLCVRAARQVRTVMVLIN